MVTAAAGNTADTQRCAGVDAVNTRHGAGQLTRVRVVLQDDDPSLRARGPPLHRLPPSPPQLRRATANQSTANLRRRRRDGHPATSL